ncbi:hypothetical protein PPL_01160 [Heterostelium album PN500]|uniref:Uncharacterized protein n=1 Tax=Heterostelium pallidum (strain ATCC 26659 / Pp 5 / PN500) TaxID=670386 RepID=D3AYA1_HETP5|nr:hypothetical protein PPL_01160 [Heterostelium album PN500]EFA85928.1 hypothetical protein PPL_01160 [Heterostelium album PN500]|eukprot:XP_020438034.1 hypothetical protein PPL_01160 [Heterostelium album PN500]
MEEFNEIDKSWMRVGQSSAKAAYQQLALPLDPALYSDILKNTLMDFIVIRLLASEVGRRWEVPGLRVGEGAAVESVFATAEFGFRALTVAGAGLTGVVCTV